MSAHHPRQRLPISCEPCRVRKIRCPRNGPACGTCIRRRVPLEQCVYSTRRKPSQRQPQQSQPQARPLENRSSSPETTLQPHYQGLAGEPDADLVARIEKLEQLLHAKNQQPDTTPSSLNFPQLDSEVQETRRLGPVTTFTTGTLIPSTSGHVRFLPFTSGRRVFSRATQESPFLSQESAMIDTPSGPYPFGEHDAENRPNLLAKLPPTEYCNQLKDLYFHSIAPLFPILHSPTFHERYHQFSKDPDQVSLAWLALLFTILGTAVLALENDSLLLKTLSRKHTPWDRVTELSERYYTAAMKCLEADRYLWRHNISTLQALLNLIYGIHHSHGQTWTLLGLVHHLALSIGCHVDPATFSLDIVETEERRRCWLGLTMLLCNQNLAITGLDIYQSVFSSRVLPTAEVWDEDIVQGQPAPIATSISSEICNPVLAARPDDPTTLQRLDAAIQADLDPLEQSYASMLGDSSSVVHTNLLLSFSHHLVLILHSNILNEETVCLPQHSWSKHRCLKSAQRVLELHADFHGLPQFMPFYWYIRGRGAFHAFHAAFVLVLALSIEPQKPCTLNEVRLLHECHARLEASKAQSQLCTRTATILGQILSSKWMTTSALVPDGLPNSVSQGPNSNRQMNPISQPADLSNGHAFTLENVGFPGLVRQIEPQQWINPMDMDWDQWDLIMNAMGSIS
ncbi:transcriptional regulator family: Fungal Specific TF [Penicillium roqueforti]|uniref:transcriptional regulator family: Fungal Specific TF n=1 Tax=Penicillium roqueforti TaxID=5082 RepID=UPI00190E299B|nr:transcriptional regulator family: Fungal Specific TF [Penicillium roqueforti]KAF9249531.1 transcriptional regulator family: Fungal Specific TF [Penicillium roqueforti]KAI2677085.1 transcriptional regulator family: Fungal Specific TF [Penicillium roqueforti]KAI2688617.1 transcriptional regulator family: Fungal Specific TF [Penicillium roqueforti]KAI2718577.1 transcriptional regulator family: Fungal Specific TF [Penicillium roqueforti]KAI2739528.1 transcriptional regulator family: Fungal Spec